MVTGSIEVNRGGYRRSLLQGYKKLVSHRWVNEKCNIMGSQDTTRWRKPEWNFVVMNDGIHLHQIYYTPPRLQFSTVTEVCVTMQVDN